MLLACACCRPKGLSSEPDWREARAQATWTKSSQGSLRYSGERALQAEGREARIVDRPGRMEAAAWLMRHPDGREALILNMLHCAEASFYKDVRALLRSCSTVIYEDLLGFEAALPVAPTPPAGLISQRRGLAPYEKSWRRADVDRPQLEALLTQQGLALTALRPEPVSSRSESASEASLRHRLALRLVGAKLEGARRQALPVGLHRLGPQDFAQSTEGLLPAYHWSLIYRRNDVVLGAVETWLQSAGPGERAALLYGAAHGHDLRERLEERGFKIVQEDWICAWRVEPKLPARSWVECWR